VRKVYEIRWEGICCTWEEDEAEGDDMAGEDGGDEGKRASVGPDRGDGRVLRATLHDHAD
jgi:hypothetical protein